MSAKYTRHMLLELSFLMSRTAHWRGTEIIVRLQLLLCALVVVSCAQAPQRPVQAGQLEPGEERKIDKCKRWFADLDARVERASVADAEAARIAGFPYLRVNRLLASYRQSAMEPAAFQMWVDLMQSLDQIARQQEIANLPRSEDGTWSTISELNRRVRDCGTSLRDTELKAKASRERLRAAAVVSPGYQPYKRVLGLYPITGQFVSAGVRRLHRDIRNTFAIPRSRLPVFGELTVYVPPEAQASLSKREVANILIRSMQNPLRIPQPNASERQRLFATFAPRWEVDVVSAADRIGQPRWLSDPYPQINLDQPAVYHRLSYTRFQGAVLLQLNYQVWFPARPRTGRFDILGGHLDGLIWRVTLDTDGEPLIYDVIHNCGCYHMFFPGQRLKVKIDRDPTVFEEPVLIPAVAPLNPYESRTTLRIAHTTHYLQRVYIDQDASPGVTYKYVDDSELRSLMLPDGGRRSLFGTDGIVPGTERGERWLLWPMGVPQPGAMRQWGHHATAFIGFRHFDDHDLLERYFEAMSPSTQPQNHIAHVVAR